MQNDEEARKTFVSRYQTKPEITQEITDEELCASLGRFFSQLANLPSIQAIKEDNIEQSADVMPR
jgi:hypothetical protein